LIPAHVVLDDSEAILVEPSKVGLDVKARRQSARTRQYSVMLRLDLLRPVRCSYCIFV
jgi:hypothetical protein